MLNMTKRATRGFTLIEILVVVAIIALLISILLPSLARAREQTRRTMCAHQLEEFGHGILMYTMDYKDNLPGPVHAAVELETNNLSTTGEYDGWHLPSFIRKYMGERSRKTPGKTTDRIASCPTALTVSSNLLSNNSNVGTGFRTFTYAINNSLKGYSASIIYGTNPAWYFGYPNEYWEDAPPNPNFKKLSTPTQYTKYAYPKKIGLIDQPSREWEIADAFTYYKGVYSNSSAAPLPLPLGRKDGQWRYGTYWLWSWASRPEVMLPNAPYHSGGVNQLCFDGHVEWQRPWKGTINSQ
jgi:prepilin-type N-terminal cleavage/methylation domain-containing protein/prepilin-type processing-associated H-X9-DG protein